jgi:hypothetical protein
LSEATFFTFIIDDEEDEEDDLCTEIIVVTENYGNENSWSFGNCNSSQEYSSYNTTVEECCQPAGFYELVCTDTYGDGWHGGYLEIGGISYCGNFSDGTEESHDVPMPGKLKFRHIFLSSSKKYLKTLSYIILKFKVIFVFFDLIFI